MISGHFPLFSLYDRDTSTLEHLHWMLLGLRDKDIGFKDHFIWNYYAAIKRRLSEEEKSEPKMARG